MDEYGRMDELKIDRLFAAVKIRNKKSPLKIRGFFFQSFESVSLLGHFITGFKKVSRTIG